MLNRNAQIQLEVSGPLRLKVAIVVLITLVLIASVAPESHAASPSYFNGVSATVQNAFDAVQTAGRDGGNTTSLVAQLNDALVLMQKASAENSSNPTQATADLGVASSLAQKVQVSASSVAQEGMSARQSQFGLSVASAVAIVMVAAALYIYGDRIYNRVWLRVYRRHVVRKVG